MDGETRTVMVSNSAKDGQLGEDHPPREAVWVIVDIEGVSTLDNFEVLKIVDDNDPYPALLGIDWAMDMNGVIDLK